MRAAVVSENGVEIQDVAKPEPKPHEVLVRVRACGLNRADLMVARAPCPLSGLVTLRGHSAAIERPREW